MSEAPSASTLTTPTPAFAKLARRLLQVKRDIMEQKDCRAEVALEEARTGMVWELRLDATTKAVILGIGAGGLLFGDMGVTGTFCGLVMAGLGYKAGQSSLRQAQDVEQAYRLCRDMSPGEFGKYLNSAKPA